MTKSGETTGALRNGLPYNRLGHGPRILVVFQGLVFESKPLTGFTVGMLSAYSFLRELYTTYVVPRKPGLPAGYTLQDMADDYAVMIKEEFGDPVDVLGTSTGGSIPQHFADPLSRQGPCPGRKAIWPGCPRLFEFGMKP